MKRKLFLIILGIITIGLLGGSFIALGIYNLKKGGLIAKSTGYGGVNCVNVDYVPAQYLPFVAEAAGKYLNGDQPALIALIQIESSWDPNSANKNSSAAGLGQFINGTARDFPEFVGGDDKHGIVWPAGKVYDQPSQHPDDARFDAKRSIFAAAHLLSGHMKAHKNDLWEAYYRGYHGFSNDAQEKESRAGADRLRKTYEELKNGPGCQGGNSQLALTPFSCEGKEYVFPVSISDKKSYMHSHHDYSATDIFVYNGKTPTQGHPIVAVTSGVVKLIGSSGKGGNSVLMLGDDGFTYYFAHMQKGSLQVKKGQKVTAGQQIGRMGDTGNTRGNPHVHFGISIAGQQAKGWFPAQIPGNGPAQKSNWEVLDAWQQNKCIDPRT